MRLDSVGRVEFLLKEIQKSDVRVVHQGQGLALRL